MGSALSRRSGRNRIVSSALEPFRSGARGNRRPGPIIRMEHATPLPCPPSPLRHLRGWVCVERRGPRTISDSGRLRLARAPHPARSGIDIGGRGRDRVWTRRNCFVVSRCAVSERGDGSGRGLRLQRIRLVRLRPARNSGPPDGRRTVPGGQHRGRVSAARRGSGLLQHDRKDAVPRRHCHRRRPVRARAEQHRRSTRRTDRHQLLGGTVRRDQTNRLTRRFRRRGADPFASTAGRSPP
jgi:hypothetical protein